MKKIISAAVAVLALSMAFAEVSVEYTQAGIISSNANGKDVKLDLNGYDSDKKVTGCFVTEISNDVAGVVFDIDPWYKDQSREKINGAGKAIDQYYGWAKLNNITLQSGVWTSRSVNRMKQDAGSWENTEYEVNKPGVINGTIAKDVTNLTEGKLATQVTYTADKTYVKAAIVDSAFTAITKSGFAFEAGTDVSDGVNVKAYFKTLTDQDVAFAVFAESTKLKENLDLVGGVTFGLPANNTFEYGVDVRARYVLNDKVALTTMNNYSCAAGTKALWDMVSAAYKVSDKMKVTMTGEWLYADLDSKEQGVLSLIPGLSYSPCYGCDITTGIIIQTAGWKTPKASQYTIPFVLHVAL